MNDKEPFSIARRLVAESLGTAILLATVVGSGIMAERLADGNMALALLANTLATGAILIVLILIFGPVSGGHFNPAVTLAFFIRREIAFATAGSSMRRTSMGLVACSPFSPRIAATAIRKYAVA